MKFAVAQVKCIAGEPEANCASLFTGAQKARELGCTCVVFPEMLDTGYEFRAIRKSAAPWSGAPFQTAVQAAKESGIYLFCGLSERDNGRIYNSLAVISPEGELIGKYRKTHLFTKDDIREDQIFAPGDSVTIVKIGNVRIGLLICYDLRFPELARTLALDGADIIVLVAAWPESRILHFTALARARAIENQCYVIAANRVGKDGHVAFGGSSCIIDPLGQQLAQGSSDKEEMISAEIQLEFLRQTRRTMPLMHGRRP
jgi:omega-amidase